MEFLQRHCLPAVAVVGTAVLLILLQPVDVQAIDSISLSWKANPVSDDIVGYRLYYGSSSRFAENGQLLINFSYDQYIDFTSWQRCLLDSGEPLCEALPDGVVSCVDLYGETPQCTIFNLQGSLFFAMTAYSSQAESDYTGELSMVFDPPPPTPGQLAVLQQVYSLLLH